MFTNGDHFSSRLVKLNKDSYMITLEKPQSPDSEAHKEQKNNLENLTRTETFVYQCINKGMTSTQIAETLGLSEDTIKTHRKSIRRKLGMVNRKLKIS